MTDQQSAKPTEPRKGTLDDPTMTIAAQVASVFVPSDGTVATIRRDEQNALIGQFFAQRIAVVAAIPDQARQRTARVPASRAGDADGLQRVVDERDLRGAGRGDMYSHRNTLAVDHHHPLRTLAPLGLPDVGAPFFADANEPSMNVFSHCSRPRASRWPRKARHIRSHVPSSSHARSRRQQVDPLGYPSGRSRHRAPVLSTHRIPSTTSRCGTRGRPPCRERVGRGRCGSIVAHCASVNRTLRWRMRTSGQFDTRC